MAVRTPSGPISTNRLAPRSWRVRTASWNRTVWRACRTQYSAEHTWSSVTGSPVTDDTRGMRGARYSRPSATLRKSASIGSISAEWKAWLTASFRVARPCAAKCSTTGVTAASVPESTTDVGPLTAARSACSPSRGTTSSSEAATATIVPPSGRACMSLPLAATSAAASSRESTPQTWAAASSPMECPARKAGLTPQDSTSRNSATSSANSAGWVYSVRSSASASSRTSLRGRARCGSRAAHTASNASAYAG